MANAVKFNVGDSVRVMDTHAIHSGRIGIVIPSAAPGGPIPHTRLAFPDHPPKTAYVVTAALTLVAVHHEAPPGVPMVAMTHDVYLQIADIVGCADADSVWTTLQANAEAHGERAS